MRIRASSSLQLQYKTINFKMGDFGMAKKVRGKKKGPRLQIGKKYYYTNFLKQKFSRRLACYIESFFLCLGAEDGLKMLTLDYVVAEGI